MPRSALPQNYIKTQTLWQDFEGDLSDWVIGAGTKEANTSQYLTGTQSMRLIAPVGSSIVATKTLSPYTDIRGGRFRFNFMPESSTVDNLQVMYVRLISPISGKYHYLLPSGSSTHFVNVWNVYQLDLDGWAVAGGLTNWSDLVNYIQIIITAKAGCQISINLDSMYYGIDQMPRCVITFDDGLSSAYSEGYTYMASKGLKGTMYISSSLIDTGGYMTSANLATMYNAGWALGNHTHNHIDLSTLTQVEIESQLTQCQTWLNNLGYTRGSTHVAYPYGGQNSTVLAAMAATGMLTGRTTESAPNYPPVGDSRLLYSYGLSSSNSLATIKATLDWIMRYGGTLFLHGHALEAVAGPGAWAIADWQALIDYMVAKKIVCSTVDEWYTGLTNPRYTTTPPVRAAR